MSERVVSCSAQGSDTPYGPASSLQTHSQEALGKPCHLSKAASLNRDLLICRLWRSEAPPPLPTRKVFWVPLRKPHRSTP